MTEQQFRERPQKWVSRKQFKAAMSGELMEIHVPFNWYWARMLPAQAFALSDNQLLYPAPTVPKNIRIYMAGTKTYFIDRNIRIITAENKDGKKSITIHLRPL